MASDDLDLVDATMLFPHRYDVAPAWKACCNPFHEILYVFSGAWKTKSETSLLEAQAGQMIVIPAGRQRWVYNGREAGTEFGSLQWLGPELRRIPEIAVIGDPLQRFKYLVRRLIEIQNWRTRVRVGDPAQDTDHTMSDQDRLIVSLSLLRVVNFELEQEHQTAEQTLLESLVVGVLNRGIYDAPVESLANSLGVGRKRFLEVFKERYQTTPKHFFQLKRMERAKEMLIDTDLPLKAIASRLKVCNAYYLSTLIKEHTGLSPSEIRRQHRH